MGTKVEHASGDIQTTVTTPLSSASSGPKTSMFGKKSGFVIPKNKLSGSLVPVFRGTKKGDADAVSEEATNQVQRKTKWGPDLTMDTTVRRGRSLAYQTRINQISQQLTLGVRELEDNEDLLSTSEVKPGKTLDHQLSNEESELLELERRETIGEILRLNPAYKAPPDYKPLLKEAKVPIPIKDSAGYNFIGLVFGSASDTLKRLEKETGAKIRVYGTKADTGGKVEVTATDGKEIENAYEDLYVHVLADTFEKVDAAVALIELLVTPVSVNPVSSSTPSTTVSDGNMNSHLSRSMPSSVAAPTVRTQGTAQPYNGPQGQFPHYPQAWFPTGPTQSPTYRQSGLVTPANNSAPIHSNTVQVSSSSFNPTNMPSLFGQRPVIAPSFSLVLQNHSVVPSRPQLPHASQPPYMQQAPPLVQTGGPRNHPLQISQPPHNVRLAISGSQGPTNAIPMNVPSHGHNAMASQNMAVSGLPTMNIPNMFSPLTVPSQSGALPQGMRGPHPIPNTFAGSGPNYDSRRPLSAALPRPQQPSSSDFTFQPHRPENAASQVAWQMNQPAHHNMRPPVQAGQSSLLRPIGHQLNPSPMQGFPEAHMRHHMNQPRAQIPPNFAGSPTMSLVPPRHPTMPGQPRNFIPPHHMNNSSTGHFPPRPGSQMMHIQENNHPGATRQQRIPSPHQHFGNHPGRLFMNSSVTQQVYDPFSPTSVPFNPQMGGGNATRVHGENDPEYEDLMESVGVK